MAHMPKPLSPAALLVTLAEPTRLRIINCLAAGPMFVSDLQEVLDIPQPTVSRHLRVLRESDIATDTQIAQFVLYRIKWGSRLREKLLKAILESIHNEEQFKVERHRAVDIIRSRKQNPAVALEAT